jgi:hypothetical protein
MLCHASPLSGDGSGGGVGDGPISGQGNPPPPPFPPEGGLSRAQQIAGPWAASRELYEFVPCAEHVAGVLEDAGYEGNYVRVTANSGNNMMSDFNPDAGESITTNGKHWGVVVNIDGSPYVFDNYVNGMPYQKCLEGLHAPGGVSPEPFSWDTDIRLK